MYTDCSTNYDGIAPIRSGPHSDPIWTPNSHSDPMTRATAHSRSDGSRGVGPRHPSLRSSIRQVSPRTPRSIGCADAVRGQPKIAMAGPATGRNPSIALLCYLPRPPWPGPREPVVGPESRPGAGHRTPMPRSCAPSIQIYADATSYPQKGLHAYHSNLCTADRLRQQHIHLASTV